jgi:hypothetical protein
MDKFKTLTEAFDAAEKYFEDNFCHFMGVGVEAAEGSKIEFYSQDDPSMDDTYFCEVNDGNCYDCCNGGALEYGVKADMF